MAHHAEVEGKSVAEIRKIWEEAAPMKRFVTAEEVTAVMMFLGSDAASAMTGQAQGEARLYSVSYPTMTGAEYDRRGSGQPVGDFLSRIT